LIHLTGDALVQAIAKGFPAGLLYSVAEVEGRWATAKRCMSQLWIDEGATRRPEGIRQVRSQEPAEPREH